MSSYRDDYNTNISSSVKAKLHKWIGKASATVREKRLEKGNSAEIMNCEPIKVELSPQHTRSRSAPIPMEKVVKKRRKNSESITSTWYVHEAIERENHRNDSYANNVIPLEQAHSMRPVHESASAPSMAKLERMVVVDCSSKEVSLGDQINHVGEPDSIGRTENGYSNGMNGYACTKDTAGFRSTRKPKFSRYRSQTAVDLCGKVGSSDNGRLASAYSLESIPQNHQQLSGQIQSRLQKWVERASSHLAGQRDRRPSEESASSTDDRDDSVYTSDSPSLGLAPGSKKENQVQKIKELELALKELVENVGVRGGNFTSKGSNTNSPGSSSRERSRHNSNRPESDCQESKELSGEEKDDLFANHARVVNDSNSNESRNNSSTDSDTAVIKMTDSEGSVFDSHPMDDDVEDLDDVIFIKSRNPTREQIGRNSPGDRRSANLQDIFFSETLIEDTPKNEDDTKSKWSPKSLEEKRSEGYIRVMEGRNISSNGMSTDGQNETGHSRTSHGNYPNSKNETGRKSERPKIKRQSVGSVGSLLKLESNLTVRESMREYLKFKDADLSAFAVECVRHANKKKQILREEDQMHPDNQSRQGRTIAQKKLESPNMVQIADSTKQKPIVVSVSSTEKNQQTLNRQQRDTFQLESASSRGSEEGNDSDKEVMTSGDVVFARTAEEAELFEKEKAPVSLPKRKESLGRTVSHPPVDPVNTSQRLYKFPSMPMFYIPDESEDTGSENIPDETEVTESKKQHRWSVALPESISTGSNPFYQGKLGPRTKFLSSSSSKLTSTDVNGNNVAEKTKSSPRPKLRQRKASAPSSSAMFRTPSRVRVDIEALI